MKKLSLLFGFVSALPVFSQTDSLKEVDIDLDNLINAKVISATKTETNIHEAPANIIVVSEKEIIERGYVTLFDLLKDLPGFDFATGLPTGEYPAHFLFRGIGDVGQTKFVIMVDGVPQNDISNGWVRNIGYNFTLVDVERIEFVSGPGSSLYGRNAYSGYINIITKTKDLSDSTKLNVKANFLGGSYNTYSPELFVSGKIHDKIAFQFSGRYYNSLGNQGLNIWDPGNYFHNNVEPDSVYTQEYGMIANDRNADSSAKSLAPGYKTSIDDYYFRGKVGDDHFTVGFNFWNKNEGLGSEVVGYEYFANTPGIDYQSVQSGKSVDFRYNYEVSEKVSGYVLTYYRNTSILPETGFTYTYQFQGVKNDSLNVTDKKKRYHSQGYLFGIEKQVNIKISEKNQLVIGGQMEQKVREYFSISIDDLYLNNNITSSVPGQNLTIQPVYFSKNGALYFQDAHQVSKDFKVTAGLRYDIDQFFGKVFNPRLAAVYAPKKGFNIKALYGKGFKAPAIFELFDEWRGNDNLLPEKIGTSELQIGYSSPNWGQVSVGGFYSTLNNLIQVEENKDTSLVPIGDQGQYSYYYQNVGNTSIYGLNFIYTLKLFKNLNLFGNYQYLSHTDKEIDNVAKNKFNFGLNYLLLNKVNFNVRANYFGKTKAPVSNVYFHTKTQETINQTGYDYVTEENPDGYLDSHFLVNATLSGKNLLSNKKWDITPQIIISNLFDVKYAFMGRQSGDGARPVDAIQSSVLNPQGFIPAYHPQQGRSILLSLKFAWN